MAVRSCHSRGLQALSRPWCSCSDAKTIEFAVPRDEVCSSTSQLGRNVAPNAPLPLYSLARKADGSNEASSKHQQFTWTVYVK